MKNSKLWLKAAAPLAVAALALSACGGGEKPAASSEAAASSSSASAPASSAPSSAPASSDAASSSAASSPAAGGDLAAGQAGVDKAAAKIKTALGDKSVVLGSEAISQTLEAGVGVAEKLAKSMKMKPEKCGTVLASALTKTPKDIKMARVVGGNSVVTLFEDGSGDYVKLTQDAAKVNATDCSKVSFDMNGLKGTQTTTAFTPEGISGDTVSGNETVMDMNGKKSKTTLVFVSRGSLGAVVEGSGASGDVKADAVALANKAIDALEAEAK